MLDGRTVVTTLSLTNVRDGTISLELEVSLHGPFLLSTVLARLCVRKLSRPGSSSKRCRGPSSSQLEDVTSQ